MEVSTSINTNLNQAKVSTEQKKEYATSENLKNESKALPVTDTVTISQAAVDANAEPTGAHGGGGVVIPPNP